MTIIANFQLLADFNAWVNTKIFSACKELVEEEYKKDRKAFFSSIHGTLNHLLVVDKLWLGRMKGTKPEVKYLAQILHDNFNDLEKARVEEDDSLIHFIDNLDEKEGDKNYTFTRMDGRGEFTITFGLTLITLFNHQTHHRGQIHTMLTQAGIKPAQMDVVDFPEAKFYS